VGPRAGLENGVESQRNTCSVSAYYAVLTGNLLPTFCTRVYRLQLQVVQEDSFDYREDGYLIAQNAVIFISRAVETTISHRHNYKLQPTTCNVY